MSEPIESISQGNYILHNIDAKKLYVQEPLFTANSGDAVYVGWRPDETVLWSGDAYTGSTAITLSEPTTAFSKIQFWTKNEQVYELGSNFPNGYAYLRYAPYELSAASACKILDVSLGVSTATYKNLTYQFNKVIIPTHFASDVANKGAGYYFNVGDTDSHIAKIVGINRKENA